MAFGEIADHIFGPGAGQPALYAVVAMGAVFTSAARAPLTSVATVVEMTGDYALTLPVMLAVAIATATSRALSYGTIYTTKLLRRGYDVDRAAPWRAFADLTAADAMRPFPAPLTVTARRDGQASRTRDGDRAAARQAPLPGTITYRSDPQAVYASESLTQTLRQLAAYGRDGLPVLSGDGRPASGLDHQRQRAARHRPGNRHCPTRRQRSSPARPPTPLPGYQVLEITIGPGSPGAGKAIGSITWPPGFLPVSVLHGSTLHEPHPDLVLAPGDRISLLTSAQSANGAERAGTDSLSPS